MQGPIQHGIGIAAQGSGEVETMPSSVLQAGYQRSAAHPNSRTARWHGQLRLLQRNAWAIALRGWVAIGFGILVLIWPSPLPRTTAWLFAVYAMLDGALALTTSVPRADSRQLWWGLALEGLTGLLMGALVAVWSLPSAKSLVPLMTVWAIGTGGFELAMALRMREEKLSTPSGPLWLALCGVLSGLFGVALISVARNSAHLAPVLFGVYAIGFGILLITLLSELRKLDGG
jgi:uncharacterized membrane protein HdeD (DUF308 family)